MKFRLVESTQSVTDNRIQGLIKKAVQVARGSYPEISGTIGSIEFCMSDNISTLGDCQLVGLGKFRIRLSQGMLQASDEDILNTLLHEIAHAIDRQFNLVEPYGQYLRFYTGGVGIEFFTPCSVEDTIRKLFSKHHSESWKRIGKNLRMDAEADLGIDVGEITVTGSTKSMKDFRDEKIRYALKCNDCGRMCKYTRMGRALQNPEKYTCGKCGGKFTAYHVQPNGTLISM